MAWTLCSKSDVIALHPITESELRDEWSEMVEALIRQRMGQAYLGMTQAITAELLSGDGAPNIHPKHTPIISVQSLTVNDVALAASEYAITGSYITLKHSVVPVGTLNVSISYTSGSSNNDPVIRLCAASMIVAIINYRRRMGADASIKWASADQKAGEPTANENLGLVSHLNRIMKQLLLRPKVRVRV